MFHSENIFKWIFIGLLFLTGAFFTITCSRESYNSISKGVGNYSSKSIDDMAQIHLHGEWRFYPFMLYSDICEASESITLDIPGSWFNMEDGDGFPLPAHGYGTYQIDLFFPKDAVGKSFSISIPNAFSSYRVLVDSFPIGGVGVVGRCSETTEARTSSRLHSFTAMDSISLFIEVANFSNNTGLLGGGLVGGVRLGLQDSMESGQRIGEFFDMIQFGGFLFVGVLFLIFFAVYSRDIHYLYFSLFLLSLSLRVGSTSSKFIFESILSDNISWNWMQRFEMLGFYMAVPTLFLYVYSFFRVGDRFSTVYRAFIALDIIFIFSIIALPASHFRYTLHPFQLIALLHMVAITFILFKTLSSKKYHLRVIQMLGALLIFFMFSIVDILAASILPGFVSISLGTKGLLFFIFLQGWLLAKRYMDMYDESIRSNDVASHHLKIIQTYTRPSVVDCLFRGEDPLEKSASTISTCILFSDIRDFTSFSENMNPMETVNFLNEYFEEMSAAINAHGGEIDKLIGDCIMALFPDADSAVLAAIDMKVKLANMNKKNQDRIRLYNGIGVHRGEVILGNIGSSSKLDYTVFGETVYIAEKIENFTKTYNLPILISEDVKKLLSGSYDLRFVDSCHIASRNYPIYEVYDYEPDHIKDFKSSIADKIKSAYEKYKEARYREATEEFETLIDEIGPHSRISGFSADPLLNYWYNSSKNNAIEESS